MKSEIFLNTYFGRLPHSGNPIADLLYRTRLKNFPNVTNA